MEGLQSAILSGDIHAVYLLHMLRIYIPLSIDLIKEFLSRNSDSLAQETMKIFVNYFKDNKEAKYILRVQNAQGLSSIRGLEYGDGNIDIMQNIQAEVQREVARMRLQGRREGNQKFLEWADTIEMIYDESDDFRSESQHPDIFWPEPGPTAHFSPLFQPDQ